MPDRLVRIGFGLTLGALMLARPHVHAQGPTIGTFRWQLQPYCNVVTVTVVQQGSQYHIDGTDDLCGAARLASVVGRAFPNPDGSIGFGLTTVTTTGAAPVHLDSRIDLATLSGPWSDSAGNSGTFAFTPGPGSGGSARPIPPGGIAPGSITGAQIAPGAVSATQLAPGAINAAAAAFGTCPAGQYLRGIQPNGTVLCEPIGTPAIAAPVDDPANAVGEYNSLAIGADGLAVISHAEYTAVNVARLRVTRCTSVACTSATSYAVDDPANTVGVHTSIAVGADGLPIIAHQDLTAGTLRVTHCSNVSCSSGTSTTVDDPAGAVGQFTSIAIGTDGLAIISHFDDATDGLRVTHCNNVVCTSATSVTVDNPADVVGRYSSLKVGTDGLAIISHWDETAGALRVTHCSNVICSAATSLNVDDPATSVGIYSSLAIGSDGLPIISHQGFSTSTLRVTHCETVTCSVATSLDVDDPANLVGRHTSIAIGADGIPVISHNDFTANALRVTRCNDVACTSATSTTLGPTSTNTVGAKTSIAIGTDGLPIIAHRDQTQDQLLVTKCASRSCR